jgi:hypothetical protein
MKSFRAYALRALPVLGLVGQASATTVSIPTIDINMTAAVQPIIDLVTAIGPLPFALIGLVLGIVIISVISGVGGFVVKLLNKLLNKL